MVSGTGLVVLRVRTHDILPLVGKWAGRVTGFLDSGPYSVCAYARIESVKNGPNTRIYMRLKYRSKSHVGFRSDPSVSAPSIVCSTPSVFM
jgi:hypothetical protein